MGPTFYTDKTGCRINMFLHVFNMHYTFAFMFTLYYACTCKTIIYDKIYLILE